MSSPKFAAMTADLLARKGTAAPSLFTPSVHSAFASHREAIVHTEPHREIVSHQPVPAAPVPVMGDADRPRRIMILVNHDELERLSIAAVKKGVSRHDIVRDALESYFRKLAAELPEACNCMANGSYCR